MQIYTRDRKCVDFDDNRIKIAISKAFKVSKELDGNIADEADKITRVVVKKLIIDQIPTVEQVQDMVEKVLMEFGYYQTAKKYILYREGRALCRQKIVESTAVDEYKRLVKENGKYFDNDAYRQFIYYRTYAKWLDEKKRREVWSETVDRYMTFMQEKVGLKLNDDEYYEIRQTILQQEVVGSMRLMQFAGDAARRCNACAYNCSFTNITSLRDFAEIIYLLMQGCGCGFSSEHLYVDQLPIISPQKEPKIINKYTVDDSKEGWADAFLFCLEKWYAGEDVEIDYSLLRPAGARLKTMGGRSSGPDPLRDLIEFTRVLVMKNVGKKLSTLNVHDIICKIGQIVVSGGVRRSSTISLSDLTDEKLRDCKKGSFWETNNQRSMANNSAVYSHKPTMIEFMKEWVALVEAGTGERGIFNRGELSKQLPTRRVELLGDKIKHMGTNPCVTKDTWVQTVDGPRQVQDLVGKEVDLIVNGKRQKMQSKGFFATGDKQVYELTTQKGYTVRLTDYHPVLILQDGKETWVELKNVKIGDILLLSNHRAGNTWSGEGTFDEGVAVGKQHYWYGKYKTELAIQYQLADPDWIKIQQTSSDFYCGFINGLCQSFHSRQLFGVFESVDGKDEHIFISVESSEKQFLALHRMLARLGIIATANDDTFGGEISIAGDNMDLFAKLIKPNNLEISTTNEKETFTDIVLSINSDTFEDVYDVTVDDVHEFCANGMRLSNCSEILLQPHGFCNLSEVICRVNDTQETLARKVKIATILGTYQSMLTDFKYLSPIWRENQETERLLGVSLTGQWDCPIVRDPEVLQHLRSVAIETNKTYATRFGINASSCITTSKPSGTTSQLTNSASGIHTRFSPYYIRRVRISATDPLFHLMRDEGVPCSPETGQSQDNATTFVFEFPIKSPDNAICADQMSAFDQLEYWKRVKTNYTEHNPSCTIYVKENEWLSVGDWIYQNWQFIGGLSFLPYADHIYPLSPYEKITKERYEELVTKMPQIHFDKLLYYEKNDNTEQRHQVACQGGVCEL